MKNKINIRNLILKQKKTTDLDTQNRILSDAFDLLDKRVDSHNISNRFTIFHILLTNRITQLSMVAGIVIAIIVFAHSMDNSVSICTLAVAEVVENIDNVDTFTYRYRLQESNGSVNHNKTSETVLYISPDYGLRLGTYVDGKAETRTYLLPAEKVMITVMPDQKQYKRNPITDSAIEQVMDEKDPRQLIRQFLSCDYTDLGCSNVSGVQARGIEVTNPAFLLNSMTNVVGRLWVNVNTQLPVRMEIEGTDQASSKRLQIITDEFRWQASLQKDDLNPFIPEDYILDENGQSNE